MTVYVADRSNNNPPGDAELDAMRAAGIRGLILKVSEGAWVDPTFAGRARAAHARGFDLGGYAFLHANLGAQAQADVFNRAVAAAGVPVPVRCCDAETADGNVQATVDTFCPAAAINLLYSGAYFARADIARPVPGVDWWIAGYGSEHPAAPWGTEAGWQFTATSRWGDLSMFDDATWAQLTGAGTTSSIDDALVLTLLGAPMALAQSDDDARKAIADRLYEQDLGREPSVADETFWAAQIETKGLSFVVKAIFDSAEAQAFRRSHGG